jgi:IS5 family transposase
MNHQFFFANSEFTCRCRQTGNEKLLGRMAKLIPWSRLVAVIELHYPKAGKGRPPYPLERLDQYNYPENGTKS